MKQNKMISIDPNLILQVEKENNNFSEAVTDALIDWIKMRHITGLSEIERMERIKKLECQLSVLRGAIVQEDSLQDIRDWLKTQPPEVLGTIEMQAEREHKNWFDIAREHKLGARKVLEV